MPGAAYPPQSREDPGGGPGDGLFCERRPELPGQGNAEIKELASILLSRSFEGFFSFTDYFGDMSQEDLLAYIAAFKTLLKQM